MDLLLLFSMTERKGLLRQHSDIKDAQSCLELYVGETFPSSINMVQSVETPLTIVQPFPVSIVDEYAKENFSSSHRYSKGLSTPIIHLPTTFVQHIFHLVLQGLLMLGHSVA